MIVPLSSAQEVLARVLGALLCLICDQSHRPLLSAKMRGSRREPEITASQFCIIIFSGVTFHSLHLFIFIPNRRTEKCKRTEHIANCYQVIATTSTRTTVVCDQDHADLKKDFENPPIGFSKTYQHLKSVLKIQSAIARRDPPPNIGGNGRSLSAPL